MWLSTIVSTVARLWRGLGPTGRGFVMGLVAGLALLTGIWHGLSSSNRNAQIALENANAALDSTRAISAGHDTVYGRIIAQKDVQLAGALRTVASQRGSKPRTVVAVAVRGKGVDTTISHPDTAGRTARTDSLVFAGPPIEGGIKATVSDSTWMWAVRLRPSPINIDLALTCSKAGPEVLAHGPAWVTTSIDGGQTDPTVCHPKPSKYVTGIKHGVFLSGAVYLALRIAHVIH